MSGSMSPQLPTRAALPALAHTPQNFREEKNVVFLSGVLASCGLP